MLGDDCLRNQDFPNSSSIPLPVVGGPAVVAVFLLRNGFEYTLNQGEREHAGVLLPSSNAGLELDLP